MALSARSRRQIVRTLRAAAAAVEGKAVRAAADMTDSDFWAVIEGMGWDGKSSDWTGMKKKLLMALSPEQISSLSWKFDAMKEALSNQIDLWERYEKAYARKPRRIGLGDDSFDDLLAHIVGLGKAEYDAVMKDPSKAYDRAIKDDFKESFAYAIP